MVVSPRRAEPRFSPGSPGRGARWFLVSGACTTVWRLGSRWPALCGVPLQGQGQGQALPHPPGRPALRAGDLGLLREPRGARELLREARAVPEDAAALPRDAGAPGALQHGRRVTRLRFGCASAVVRQTSAEPSPGVRDGSGTGGHGPRPRAACSLVWDR